MRFSIFVILSYQNACYGCVNAETWSKFFYDWRKFRRQCVNVIDTTWGRIYFSTCENFGQKLCSDLKSACSACLCVNERRRFTWYTNSNTRNAQHDFSIWELRLNIWEHEHMYFISRAALRVTSQALLFHLRKQLSNTHWHWKYNWKTFTTPRQNKSLV